MATHPSPEEVVSTAMFRFSVQKGKKVILKFPGSDDTKTMVHDRLTDWHIAQACRLPGWYILDGVSPYQGFGLTLTGSGHSWQSLWDNEVIQVERFSHGSWIPVEDEGEWHKMGDTA